MLIKGKQRKSSANKRYKQVTLVVLCALLGLLLLSQGFKSGGDRVYVCDGERSNGTRFQSNGHSFMNGKTQSDDKARSGKYSSKCDETNLYGMGLEIKGVKSGDIFEVTIWRESSKGWGVLAITGDWGFYYNEIEADQTDGDWERIKARIKIPFGVEDGLVKVYPYNTRKEGVVFFDDLKIRHIRSNTDKLGEIGEYAGAVVDLQVDQQDVEFLRKKRGEAYKTGNLITGKSDLVDAKFNDGEQEFEAKIRLKGDLLDHLVGNKWSFRIVPEKGESWKGMQEFSVHNSGSRAHVDEWLLHQIFEKEGVMSTAYDFLQMNFNGEVLGVYAYEQHFNSLILERGNRPKGPIIRISEEGLWQNAPKALAERPAWYESAQIESFDRKEVLSNPILYEQFIQGQSLLQDFRDGKKKPGAVFDLDLLAKYFAILDLCQSWHSATFTNMRFYYNPVTGKLEPIGYDGYTDDGTKYQVPPNIFGAYYNSRTSTRHRNDDTRMMYYYLFNDKDYMQRYIGYVEQFTSKPYVDKLVETYYDDFKSREKFIQREHTTYKFDWKYYFRNAPAVQKILYPLEHVSLKAYRQSKENGSQNIALEGYHLLPLEILGFGNKTMDYPLKEPLLIEAFNKDLPAKRFTVETRGSAKNVFFRTLGTDSVFTASVFEWSAPESKPLAPTANIQALQKLPFLRVSAKEIRFLPGTHRISQSLHVPEGYLLKLGTGTRLILEGNASIISYSPLSFQGTLDKPIQIRSEGSGGIALIRTEGVSSFQHVVFDGLASIRQGGRYMSGGLSFYESEADLKSLVFLNSNAEDALSAVRSTIRLVASRFSNCSGDGLDADYSKLNAQDVVFEKIGGDALEVSGGRGDLDNISISESLNAGLNANKAAIVSVKKISIANTETGIIAKDQADLTVDNADIQKTKLAFKVFQELDAFKNAKLTIKNYKTEAVQTLHKRDAVSTLILKGKEIQE